MSSNVLKNFVIHATAHNKYLEEAEMWKKRNEELNKNSNKEESLQKQSRHRSSSTSSDKRVDERKRKMNSESIGPSLKLFESNDRWDHSGYKELYPNEFEKKILGNSDSSSSSSGHSKASSSKIKKKKKKKDKKKKKKKDKKKKS
jgi:hypothetical protein